MEVRGVLVSISPTPHLKTIKGRSYWVRYMGVQAQDQQYLIRLTEERFRRFFPFDYQIPRTGSILIIRGGYLGKFTLSDGSKMLFSPKSIEVIGHLEEEREEKYLLEDIRFYDDYVILRNEHSKAIIPKKIWDQMTGLPTSWHLNKVKKSLKEDELKEAFVGILATFRVHFWWDRRARIRKRFYYSDSGDWRLVAHNLTRIREVYAQYELSQKLERFLETVKELIESKWMIQDEELRNLLIQFGLEKEMTLTEAKDYVISKVWKKRYDEQYFNYLKKYAKEISVSKEGFLFRLPNGFIIFETPEVGNATYVFFGDPEFIISQIEAIRRSDIPTRTKKDGKIQVFKGAVWKYQLVRLAEEFPEKFKWFIERIIHDEDGSSWYEKIRKYTEGGEER